MCYEETERTLSLGRGLFAFEHDQRALLIVRGDVLDQVDDQRTAYLSLSLSLFYSFSASLWCAFDVLFFFVCRRSRQGMNISSHVAARPVAE